MTNQTLIDAMALRIRQMIAPVDLGRDRAFRDRFNEAGRIVLEYVTKRMAEPPPFVGLPDLGFPSPEDTPLAPSIVRCHADTGSGFAREALTAHPAPPKRVIEADELVVTTRDAEFAIECQRAMKPQRPVWFNGLSFAVTQVAQAGFENRWVLTLMRCHQMTGGPHQDVNSPELTDEQLSRLRPARGPGEPREGPLESVIDVRNDNGSAMRVSFTNGRGEAWFKLVEIEGDPRHGLTEEQWAFKETLREAFTAGQSMTFEFDGRKFTGVRIASFTTEA